MNLIVAGDFIWHHAVLPSASQGNHGADETAPGGAGNAGQGALWEVTGPQGSRQESIALSRVWGINDP